MLTFAMVLFYSLPERTRIPWTVAAVLAGVALNGLFKGINDALSLPIFLDSIFTVMVTALFGLWPGLAVGVITNAFLELTNGFPGYLMPFAAVNAATALVTHLAARKGAFESMVGAFWTMVALALANALLGAFIVTLVFGGITDEPVDTIVRAFRVTGRSVFSAAFLGRIFINIVDKGIAVALTYPLYLWVLGRREAGQTAEAAERPGTDVPGPDETDD